MTVTSNDRRIDYAMNGEATEFNGPRIYDTNHLIVSVIDDESGDIIELVYGDDYQVSRVGLPQSLVTVTDPRSAGYTLALVREVPYVQETSLRNQGAYLPEVLEKQLDLIVMMILQLLALIDGDPGPEPETIALDSGTFEPNTGVLTNVDSVSAPAPWRYMRVGDTLTVSGYVDITCSASSGEALVSIQMPQLDENFSGWDSALLAAGTGATLDGQAGAVVGSTGSEIRLGFTATTTDETRWAVHATCRVFNDNPV